MEFKQFLSNKEGMDDTWKFWIKFVYRDFLPYIALFIAIRSGNWLLRVAAIKAMAAGFSAFDHPMYQRLITNHMLDLIRMPQEVIQFFRAGGFVVSITGRYFHSVGIDEAHEMLINKQTKQAIVRPTKDYINRIAQYIPYRMRIVDKLKEEILPLNKQKSEVKFSPFTSNSATEKSEANVQAQMKQINEANLLPVLTQNRGLFNPSRRVMLMKPRDMTY